jgi:hypothetical protein
VRSPLARALIGAAALVIVVVLFVVLAGGDDGDDGGSTTATQTTATQTTPQRSKQGATGATRPSGARPERPARSAAEPIAVRGGEPVGGVRRLEYDKGDRVRFLVRSDVADEVHVHGYDISKDLAAGGTVIFSFPAEIEGVFEVELEQRHQQIAELRVNP